MKKYDVLIEVGYNDDPPIPGCGSAIFIHIAPETGATEGCIALGKEVLLHIIAHLHTGSTLKVLP